MITSQTAIEKSIEFLQSLKPEYLGGKPEGIRLETIQLFGKEWAVSLSFAIPSLQTGEHSVNRFLEALATRRFLKEFEVNAENGEVIGMRNPEAPNTMERNAA